MIIEEDDASIIMRYESEALLEGSTMDRVFFGANLHISLYNDTGQGWLVGIILKNCLIICIICVAWFGSTV